MLRVPDKQPYEGKATQRQKQRIWDLGFRDQSVIDTLGKRQASFVIDQLCGAYRDRDQRRSKKRMYVFSAIMLLSSLGTLAAARFSHSIQNSDFAAGVIVFGFFGGIGLFVLAKSK